MTPATDELTLVTGAAGFLGTHVCSTLIARGARVRGMVREESQGHLPLGVEAAVVTDLLDRDDLRRALDGVTSVVHLAARAHVTGEYGGDALAAYRRVNVEGTRGLLQEAVQAGVRRVVFASSVKAVGEANAVPWSENEVPHPSTPYGISKLEAEALVAGAVSSGFHAATLRLPLVYGPGVKANMRRLFMMVNRGVPLPLGGVANRRSLVYVGNVMAAIDAVLTTPAASGQAFFVTDGHDVSTPELIDAIAQSLERPSRLIPAPIRTLRLLARAGDGMSRLVPWPLTTPALGRLLGSLTVLDHKLRGVTGFVPPYQMRDGLAATAAWFRALRGAA